MSDMAKFRQHPHKVRLATIPLGSAVHAGTDEKAIWVATGYAGQSIVIQSSSFSFACT
jgi:hypothetical protein